MHEALKQHGLRKTIRFCSYDIEGAYQAQNPSSIPQECVHSSPKRLQPLCGQFTWLKPRLPPRFYPWSESCLFCRELVNCPTCSLHNNCKEKTFQSCSRPRMLPLSSGFIVIGSLGLPGRAAHRQAAGEAYSLSIFQVCAWRGWDN